MGWAALTESEPAVVRLVAEGLTNHEAAERLYISPHTVGEHLRHVFEKLDIKSRVSLSRIAAQHPDLAQEFGRDRERRCGGRRAPGVRDDRVPDG